MDYELPSEFDLIIVGTGKRNCLLNVRLHTDRFIIGMVESVISAAASRIGKKVLHVDKYVENNFCRPDSDSY